MRLPFPPILIYALSDPDRGVALAARDGLRFISRKFDGVGLPDKFTPAEQTSAIDAWQRWYRTVRPDAELE